MLAQSRLLDKWTAFCYTASALRLKPTRWERMMNVDLSASTQAPAAPQVERIFELVKSQREY